MAVLSAAKAAADRFRSHFLATTQGEGDEHLRWISASRSQPTSELAKLVAGAPTFLPACCFVCIPAMYLQCLFLAW